MYLNLPTVSALRNCFRKIFTVGIPGHGDDHYNCQTSIEKPYLAFDCKYVSGSLT